MDRPSKPVNSDVRHLRIEELEERIAPVIVTSNPSTWVQGYIGGDPEQPIFDGWLEDPSDPEEVGTHLYWIFYVGQGQADIGPGNTESDLIGNFISDITITGSNMDSGLFILAHPASGDPDTEWTGFFLEQGSILVNGDITVTGDMGLIAIDGFFGFFGGSTLFVDGNLGKLDVGCLVGDVYATGDIWEIAVDAGIGGYQDVINTNVYWVMPTLIAAEGNIGAIRAGVGLTAPTSTSGTDVIGGFIAGTTMIRANYDNAGPRGIIDLIEIVGGSLWTGSSGIEDTGDISPSYSAGPGGNIRFFRLDGVARTGTPTGSMNISEVAVGTDTPGFLRTVIDDSGGVLTINPQYEIYTLPDGSTQEYWGAASYLAIPVDRGESGPAVVIARLTVGHNVDLNVTGNVEFGEVTFFTAAFNVATGQLEPIENIRSGIEELDFAAGTSIDDLVITGPGDLAGLVSPWHIRFAGTGEADIYYVHGDNMPIFQNLTNDGDIVAVDITGQIVYISASRVGGDIGTTESITPYLLKGPLYNDDGDVLWVDDDGGEGVSAYAVEGSLTRLNGFYGVRAGGNIYGVSAGGAIADIRSSNGNISLVVANVNGQEDLGSPYVDAHIMTVRVAGSLGQFEQGLVGTVEGDGILYGHTGAISPYGKLTNTLGDGIFGHIMTGTGTPFPDAWGENGFSGGGDIGVVRVGAGTEPTHLFTHNAYPTEVAVEGTGEFVTAGIYSSGRVLDVRASGAGTGIFGDVAGIEGVVSVVATNQAVIDGVLSEGGFLFIRAFSSSLRTGDSVGSGPVESVRAIGAGSYIANVDFGGSAIGSIIASGGADGIFFISVTSGSNIGTISGSGEGVVGALITAPLTIGRLESTGEGSRLDTIIAQAFGGIRIISTPLLVNSDIYALSVGQLATLDRMEDTVLTAGTLKTVTVREDVVRSTISVGGPLDKLTIGGVLDSSFVMSQGPHAALKNIMVTGDIINSEILSERNIVSVQSKTGSIIDTTIQALGSSDLDVDLTVTRTASIGKIMAAGGISGRILCGFADESNTNPELDTRLIANIKSIKAGGDISADIVVGVFEFGAALPADIQVTASLGSLNAGGAFTGDLQVGWVETLGGGGIGGDVTINSKVGKIKTGGNEAGNLGIGIVSSIGPVSGDVSIVSSLAGIDSGGDITGLIRAAAVVVNGDLTSEVVLRPTVGPLKAAGSISADFRVGTIDTAGSFDGQATITSAMRSIDAEGNISGNLYVGRVETSGGTGTASWRGMVGKVESDGAITGDVTIRGNLTSLKAAGDVGQAGGTIDVSGNVGTISAGGPDQTGDILSDVTIGGKLSTLSATGAFPASLTVGGDANKITVGGDLGGLGDVVDIGGKLSNLTVGSTVAHHDILAALNVGGNAGNITVFGNTFGDIDVTGDAAKMVFDLVVSDIHVGGDLRYFSTQSGQAPGIPPIDLELSGPLGNGTLTVDGDIIRIV